MGKCAGPRDSANTGRQAESVGAGAAASRWHTRSLRGVESSDGILARPRARSQGRGAVPAMGQDALRRTRVRKPVEGGARRELFAAGCSKGAAGPGSLAHRANAKDRVLRPRSV